MSDPHIVRVNSYWIVCVLIDWGIEKINEWLSKKNDPYCYYTFKKIESSEPCLKCGKSGNFHHMIITQEVK